MYTLNATEVHGVCYERKDMKVKVGDKIRILWMSGEPRYAGKEGIVTNIDSIGQLHGTWGGLAVIPGEDEFKVIT